MKKLLALVLALVMTLGLATVGASAAFSDADSIEYKEAVDVMSAVGVLAGMDDGSFQPTGSLTREQGAKIITYILLGGKTAGDALTATSAPFSDVAADRWSAGSIQYCVANGIIAGKGDGTFGPTEPLTGYAFGKMLLGALGYDAAIEGLTGNEWQVNTAKLISRTGLSDKIAAFVGTKTVTREVAAQMGLNALKADMVEYTGGVNVSAGTDTTVSVNATRSAVVSAANYATAIDATAVVGGSVVQLGEQVFGGDLKVNTNAVDDFGAPATRWSYKVAPVSDKTAKEPVVTYTSNMTSAANRATVKSNLSGYTVSVPATGTGRTTEYSYIEMNGEEIRPTAAITSVENIAYLTADGRTVEVYANDAANPTHITHIVIRQYDLFQVNFNSNKTISLARKSAAAFASTDSPVALIVSKNIGAASITVNDSNTNNDYYEELSKLAAKDYVALAIKPTTDGGNTMIITTNTGNNIAGIGKFTTSTGAVTSISGSKYTVGGTQYAVASNGTAANITGVDSSKDYNLYFDQYNNILFADEVTASTTTYARILATTKDGNAASGYTYNAKLLLQDGSTKWVAVAKYEGVKMADQTSTIKTYFNDADTTIDGRFCNYTVNGDDTYNLTKIHVGLAGNGTTITTGSTNYTATGPAVVVLNSKTSFLVETAAGSGKYRAYTGISNVPNLTFTAASCYVYDGDNDGVVGGDVIKMVVIDGTTSAAGKDSEYLFIYNKLDGSFAEGNKTIYTYGVIKNGVMTTVETELDPAAVDNALYINAVYDADGRLTAVGTRMTPGFDGTDYDTSVLGKTGNAYLVSDGDETLAVSNSVLSVDWDDANSLSIATSATASGAVTTPDPKTFAVSDDFIAYEVTPGSSSTTLTKQVTLGAGSGTNPATALVNGDEVFFTTNGDGEVNALYIVKAAYTAYRNVYTANGITLTVEPTALYMAASTSTASFNVTVGAGTSDTNASRVLTWKGMRATAVADITDLSADGAVTSAATAAVSADNDTTTVTFTSATATVAANLSTTVTGSTLTGSVYCVGSAS